MVKDKVPLFYKSWPFSPVHYNFVLRIIDFVLKIIFARSGLTKIVLSVVYPMRKL